MEYGELKYRNCLFCEHFCFVTGTRDYSDVTPGEDVELYCGAGVWRLDAYDDGESVLISHMLTARSCDKYEERKELKVGAKVRIKRETVERFKMTAEGSTYGEVIQKDNTHYDGKFYRPFKVRFSDERESWWAGKELRVI